jgi:Zn-dependent M28 family amino/carboxypeptidase
MTKQQKIGLVFLVLILLFNLNKNTPKPNHIDNPQPVVVVEPKIEPTIADIVSSVDQAYIKDIVYKLSSKELCGRGTGTVGNEMAKKLICTELEKVNIPYITQSFKARGKESHNIIAHISPTNKTSNKIIVIGAHFDHLGGDNIKFFPGADDNSSGVAGVLAVAKAISQYKTKLKHTISIQFYSAEELGLIGSSYYCKNPLLPLDEPNINNHIAMINMDMIGYLKSSYLPSENCTEWKLDKEWTTFSNLNNRIDIKDTINNLSKKYIFAKNISGYRPGGSDHAPFYKAGVPVLFLHTGLHSNYHKVTDTPDKLNYSGIREIAKLAIEVLVSIDNN